jgi:hypothetical protein
MILIPALRELILIRKLQGAVLPPEEALINTYSPLRTALLSSLNPFQPDSFQATTYVLSHERQNRHRLRGIAQVWENRRRATAQVAYLAPDRGWEDADLWPRWLERLCRRAGEGAMRRVVACLPVDDVRVPAFRHAAFHVYSQEDILRLASMPAPTGSEQSIRLRPRRAGDAWSLARLYDAITPPVVQQAEGLSQAGRDEAICTPITLQGTQGYVLEMERDIFGYVETRQGAHGAWIRFLLHPQAGDMAEALVRSALTRLSHQEAVYCGLPDYQGGIRSALQNAGFEPFGRQVLLVRYTAVFVRRSAVELASALEKGVEIAAPVVRASESCAPTQPVTCR